MAKLTKIEKQARDEYTRETDNHPTIHCNRFPTWEELTQYERDRRIALAALAKNVEG